MTKKTSVTTALLLAIVPGVAIYWLTQGLPSWLSKTSATEQAASQSVDGRVIDGSAQRLLSGAEVSLELAGATSSDTTDSLGRYLFLAKAVTPVTAILTIRAQGYEAYSLNIALNGPELTQDVLLTPQAPTPVVTPRPGPAQRLPLQLPDRKPAKQPQAKSEPAANPALPRVQLTNLAASVPYARRQLATAVKITPSKGKN